MPPLLARLWEVVGALGGGLALIFIVLIALGLVALTALFVMAAVVVLERFARIARSPLAVVGFGAVWALVLTALALPALVPDATRGTAAEVAERLARSGGVGLAVTAAAVLVTRLALTRLRPRTLGFTGLGAALGALALLGGAGLVPDPAAAAGLRGLGMLLGLTLAGLVALGLVPLAAAGFWGSRGSAEWFIAGRYLFARRRQTLISVITAICVAGVAAGVWLIITVLSVMNGFESIWRDEIIGNRAHFNVFYGLGPFSDYEDALGRVLEVPGVVAASPYLDAEGMVRGDAGQIIAVRVRGVDPVRVGAVTDLRADLVAGSLEGLEQGANGDDPGIVVGGHLASALGLGVGDAVLLVSPFGGPPTPLGPAPRLARFRVAGVFESSFFQYDEVFTYTSLAAAQSFRRAGDVVDGIEVRTTDLYRSRQVAAQVEAVLGRPFFTRDWKDFFPAFFQALKTERVMMFVLLTMIMVVAAFAIVVTLVMMIMEKSGDIAILKAMGADDASVERIFAIEGALIGLLGTALGLVAGIIVSKRLDWIQRQVEAVTGIDTLPESVYQFSTLPSRFDPLQIAAVLAIAMGLALGATFLPSRQGARLDPAEALRYE